MPALEDFKDYVFIGIYIILLSVIIIYSIYIIRWSLSWKLNNDRRKLQGFYRISVILCVIFWLKYNDIIFWIFGFPAWIAMVSVLYIENKKTSIGYSETGMLAMLVAKSTGISLFQFSGWFICSPLLSFDAIVLRDMAHSLAYMENIELRKKLSYMIWSINVCFHLLLIMNLNQLMNISWSLVLFFLELTLYLRYIYMRRLQESLKNDEYGMNDSYQPVDSGVNINTNRITIFYYGAILSIMLFGLKLDGIISNTIWIIFPLFLSMILMMLLEGVSKRLFPNYTSPYYDFAIYGTVLIILSTIVLETNLNQHSIFYIIFIPNLIIYLMLSVYLFIDDSYKIIHSETDKKTT